MPTFALVPCSIPMLAIHSSSSYYSVTDNSYTRFIANNIAQLRTKYNDSGLTVSDFYSVVIPNLVESMYLINSNQIPRHTADSPSKILATNEYTSWNASTRSPTYNRHGNNSAGPNDILTPRNCLFLINGFFYVLLEVGHECVVQMPAVDRHYPAMSNSAVNSYYFGKLTTNIALEQNTTSTFIANFAIIPRAFCFRTYNANSVTDAVEQIKVDKTTGDTIQTVNLIDPLINPHQVIADMVHYYSGRNSEALTTKLPATIYNSVLIDIHLNYITPYTAHNWQFGTGLYTTDLPLLLILEKAPNRVYEVKISGNVQNRLVETRTGTNKTILKKTLAPQFENLDRRQKIGRIQSLIARLSGASLSLARFRLSQVYSPKKFSNAEINGGNSITASSLSRLRKAYSHSDIFIDL